MPQAASRTGRRIGHRIGRFLLLLLAGVLVLTLGTVVTGPAPGTAPVDTTEQARSQARAELLDLAAGFEALAAGRSGQVLMDTSVLLSRQAQLFALETQQPGTAPAAPSGQPARPPGGLGESVSRLAAASRWMLGTAQEVEPGLARLLASAGAAGYAQARLLQRETGTPEDLPRPWQPAPASWAASCSGPGGTRGAAEPSGGRPTTADALAAVVVSERKLAYAYEAALPRLAGAAGQAARKRYLQHRELIERWEGIAAGLCVKVPPAEAAWQLPAGLSATPGPVLADAEAAAAAAFADLVAFSGGAVRAQASAGLLGATLRIADTAGAVPAAPGIQVRGQALP